MSSSRLFWNNRNKSRKVKVLKRGQYALLSLIWYSSMPVLMPVLEQKVSQIVEVVEKMPKIRGFQKSTSLHCPLKGSGIKTFTINFSNDFYVEASLIFAEIAEIIENNWQEFGDPQKIDKYIKIMVGLAELSGVISTLFKTEELKKPKTKEVANFKKTLKYLLKSANQLYTVLNDTIESIEIASEVNDLRFKPVNEDDLDEARQLLFFIKNNGTRT